MSGIPSSNEVLQVTQPVENIVFKLGAVADLFENNTAKIKFDGEETASEKHYAYVDGYVPTVGDRVVLIVVSSSHIILGKISYNTDPTIGGSAGNFTSLKVINSVGFYGTNPVAKTAVTDQGSLQSYGYAANATYGTNEQYMLDLIATDVSNIYNKLKNLLNALQATGLI
jgi:hypothetical protein